jgi:hypothetical protein
MVWHSIVVGMGYPQCGSYTKAGMIMAFNSIPGLTFIVNGTGVTPAYFTMIFGPYNAPLCP